MLLLWCDANTAVLLLSSAAEAEEEGWLKTADNSGGSLLEGAAVSGSAGLIHRRSRSVFL
ncbi:hypothetical protein GCM10009724_27030 [Microbacterium lacticum]|nr:hypothetical protein MLA01_26690 [Microbacterium lacticum]GGI74645.1 hypothetical protein GCM10009724_27030 [Microbacterium lacticum]